MFVSRRRLTICAVLTAALALICAGLAGADRGPSGGGPAQSEDGLVVQDLDHGTTAQQLAQSLVGGGVSISNVTYTGTNNAAGAFTDTGPGSVVGFNDGVVMGSGSVQTTATSTADSKGVEGPNQGDGNTTSNGSPGDADLDALSGKVTEDAAILQFDFVPQFSTVQFTYVFTSDEYNEWANTQFNDTFGFFINGQNCAVVPGTTTPVGVNTINGGNPLGTNPQHPELYRNNDVDDGGGSINTEMDGLTVELTCNANVNAGVTNHLKLAIADASDSALDSNVFIEAGSLVSGTQISTSLSGGGQSGSTITIPAGTSVTDQATLSGANTGTAGGTVTYTVYQAPGCTTVYADGGTKTVTNGVVPASNAVQLDSAGTYNWVASYSGDPTHNASTSGCGDEVATVTGAQPVATSLTVSAATGDFADATTVSAVLKKASDSSAIAGKSVTLTLNGSEHCTATTDATGTASCQVTPGEPAGTYPLTASFAGDGDFLSSNGSNDFVVTHEETGLSYTGDTSAVNGQPVTLSGVLATDDPAAGTPLGGKLVTFTLGSGGSAQSCSGTTNASGAASCQIASVSQAAGAVPVAASFAGDTFYQAASATSSVDVFVPPATGAFVIGDKSAGSPTIGKAVNFWGSQWAKNNSFSGGSAPSAMKGFADSPKSLSCGDTWTTDPGNSSSPPTSLPSQINVIVSSKVTKSGSKISGTILHIVVVQVGPGYGPAPGQPGNGTIVGTIC
jgi:Bacterial Ig-like domain (group 3)